MTYQSWRSNWGPLAFVWGLWLLFSYYLVVFVRTFGVDCPHYDEWENVPALTGEQPLTWKWLWHQHNEHRIVVPRLVYLALGKLTHGDFRAGMVFNIIVLSLEALALILVARRLRGHTEYSDGFFPLVLLTWGQCENLYWSMEVCFLCSSGLAIAFLVLSVGNARLTTLGAVGLGLCGVLLPLVGGNGLALTPAVSIAVLLAGWGEWKRGPGWRWRALGVWAMGLVALAITAYYFVDYKRPSDRPPSPSMQATFDGSLQFLSTGLGHAVYLLWPESKPIILVSLAAAVALLGCVVLFRTMERARAFRLLLVIGGMVSLALGTAWARVAMGDLAMFAPRYPTIAAPFWCALYVAWEALGRSQLRKFAQMGLFFFAGSLAVKNHDLARQASADHSAKVASIVDDIRAGVLLPEIVRRHYAFTYYGGEDVLKERMHMLHVHQIGVFRDLKE